MTAPEAKKRIAILVDLVARHNHAYHVLDTPLISDEAYDALFQELVQLESTYPEFAEPNSPTQKIGGAVRNEFTKYTHPYRQWSFDNIFDYN